MPLLKSENEMRFVIIRKLTPDAVWALVLVWNLILYSLFGLTNLRNNESFSIGLTYLVIIGVRDQFRLGGLRSVARILYPLLARKSSGFARILHGCFARIWLFEKF